MTRAERRAAVMRKVADAGPWPTSVLAMALPKKAKTIEEAAAALGVDPGLLRTGLLRLHRQHFLSVLTARARGQ